MELEFDNEIDALLRKDAAAQTITISEFAGVHLDADEIAAFVENAVPVHTRTNFIQHFAGCDRCRKALVHAAVLHSEEPETAGSIVAPVDDVHVPWYRRLFLFPNLAYVMGGLIVMFAGFIGISVYNSGSRMGQFEMSKSVSSGEPATVDSERNYAANTNAMAEPMADAASNTANAAETADNDALTSADSSSNSAAQQKGPYPPPDIDDMRPGAPLATPAMQPPPAPLKENQVTVDGVDSKRAEELPTSGRSMQDLQQPKDRAKTEQKAPLTMTPSTENSRNAQITQQNAPLKAKGPYVQRNDNRVQEQRNVQLSRDREADKALKNAPKKTDSVGGSLASSSSERKQVGGKTFVFRQGAWYDTVYNGQGTTNIRRNSGDYKKLDSGLRGIANSILGTVVTVWNGKAYRID